MRHAATCGITASNRGGDMSGCVRAMSVSNPTCHNRANYLDSVLYDERAGVGPAGVSNLPCRRAKCRLRPRIRVKKVRMIVPVKGADITASSKLDMHWADNSVQRSSILRAPTTRNAGTAGYLEALQWFNSTDARFYGRNGRVSHSRLQSTYFGLMSNGCSTL